MKTTLGRYRRDESGIWHYEFSRGIGNIRQAIADAQEFKPKGPSWFWFNGTPAPMHLGETSDQLFSRWRNWRDDYHSRKVDAVDLLVQMTK